MILPVVNSFIWVSIEKICVLGIQFVGTIILARLIGPNEFGMIGILSVFLSLANIFADSGMGGALVREQSIQRNDYHTLFIYNGLISIVAYVILFLLAPSIAKFYNISELCDILRTVGLSVIFTSLSVTQSIHLLRNLKFKVMAVCAISSSLLSTIIAVSMAYFQMGVWALVAQTVIYSISYSLLLFIAVRYIPQLIFDKSSFKRQFSYGINILGANLINTVQTNLSTSIVGRLFPLSSTGFYTQAARLQGLPNNILTSIIDKTIFPIISRQETLNLKVETAFSMAKYIYLFAFPLWGYCIIMSEPLVRLILGEAWIESSWMFSLLCVAGPFYTIKTILRSVYKSTGDTKVILRIDLIISIIGIGIMVFLGQISMRFLIFGVVTTSVISMLLFIIDICFRYGYSLLSQLQSLFVTLSPTVVSSLLLYFVTQHCTMLHNDFVRVLLMFIIYVLLCCCMYILFKNKEFITIYHKYVQSKRCKK